MIPFAVDWDKSAEMDLARIWLDASDPKAVTMAAARIDEFLALGLVNRGRALSEGSIKAGDSRISHPTISWILPEAESP